MTPPPRRVYIHIGAPKTGTTYLQTVLWRNRRHLEANGMLYPVDSGRAHFHAALDLREAAFGGHRDPAVAGSWDRVAGQVTGWSGGAVLSHELLAAATAEQVQRAVASVQPADVHVIYTARDLARQIPATWQESVKNGRTLDFSGYVRRLSMQEPKGRAATIFWRSQDPVSVLGRWSAGVAPERVHLVTVPPSGADPSLLWQRFCGVLGLDAAGFDLEVTRENVSLGLAESELVRRLNERLEGRLSWPAYEAVVKHGLAEKTLAARTASPRVALPARDRRWVVERARQIAAALEGAGYDVVGDLRDLVPAPEPDASAGGVAHPDADEVIDAAVDVIAQRMIAEAATRAGSPKQRMKSARSSLRSRLRR